jgi:hypothetical protein
LKIYEIGYRVSEVYRNQSPASRLEKEVAETNNEEEKSIKSAALEQAKANFASLKKEFGLWGSVENENTMFVLNLTRPRIFYR